MPKKKTTEEFIVDARKVHGDKYDYSNVIYNGNKINVSIICPMHGKFEQTPYGHVIKKNNCPICAKLTPRKTKWSETEISLLKSLRLLKFLQ